MKYIIKKELTKKGDRSIFWSILESAGENKSVPLLVLNSSLETASVDASQRKR
jgi:hypothetical protein